MNENENIVTEQAVENAEVAEPKKYTEAELNARVDELLGKKIARKEAKIRKEYDRKYGELENVLKAGTGKKDVDELTSSFKDFYEKKGIKIMPTAQSYSDKDIEVLARADADYFIRGGDDEVVEEVDRLAEIGADNMTAREKALFKVLAEHRRATEQTRDLASIGVTADVYNSSEFKEYASQFKSNVPIKTIYENFAKTQPKKNYQTMGSMKQTPTADSGVKDFYSFEEASKFSKADFDKNPALYDAVRKSMTKW